VQAILGQREQPDDEAALRPIVLAMVPNRQPDLLRHFFAEVKIAGVLGAEPQKPPGIPCDQDLEGVTPSGGREDHEVVVGAVAYPLLSRLQADDIGTHRSEEPQSSPCVEGIERRVTILFAATPAEP